MRVARTLRRPLDCWPVHTCDKDVDDVNEIVGVWLAVRLADAVSVGVELFDGDCVDENEYA